MRQAIRWLITGPLVLCAAGLLAGSVAAKDKTSEPNSKAYGKTLSEWITLYNERALSGSTDTMVNKVKLLPIPAGVWQGDGSFTSADPSTLVGELDVTLKPGTPFVLPIAVWYGESYNTGQQDDAEVDASVFTGSHVLITMDGDAIIDSDVDDLSDWYVAPSYFDPPVVYATPTSYGSTQANFVQGLGFVHGPLSKGTHTLTLESEIIAFVPDYFNPGDLDIGVKYSNTWTIVVTK